MNVIIRILASDHELRIYLTVTPDRRSDTHFRLGSEQRNFQVEAQRVKIVEGGKLVIPALMRRELGIGAGDTVMVDIDNGELRVRSVSKALERARAILRRHIPEGSNLADELIEDRRAEAEHE